MSALFFILITILIIISILLVWVIRILIDACSLIESVNNNLIDIETAIGRIDR